MTGRKLFVHQAEALDGERGVPAEQMRVCLHFKTGSGKSLTGLKLVAQAGCEAAVVVAPPSTYPQWVAAGAELGVEVHCMSHAKFRMATTKLSRNMAVIADEFHLFGGHGGKGWKKLDGLSRGLKAPLILMSATPNYNDADRVYCIQHILDPRSCKGGFLEFIYSNCTTEQNNFGMMPIVTGFQRYSGVDAAAKYLADLPHVYYLPDDLVYKIEDIEIPEKIIPEMDRFGLDVRRGRIIASGIEEKHARIFRNLISDPGLIEPDVYDELHPLLQEKPVLVFAAHSTVADALGQLLYYQGVKHAVITGKTPAKKKAAYLDAFRDGVLDVLVGTASLATGTDGLDKVCDTLIILDDTDDASLRRQLIGRIMPRGLDTDATGKKVYRIVLTP